MRTRSWQHKRGSARAWLSYASMCLCSLQTCGAITESPLLVFAWCDLIRTRNPFIPSKFASTSSNMLDLGARWDGFAPAEEAARGMRDGTRRQTRPQRTRIQIDVFVLERVVREKIRAKTL
mmetsp:Transcript_5106/g.14564  ORF Transcript_5106/g.14564 Transcript_5106/m.14564 type:complete len:121 (+) Transcript_5106:628-990(+)